MSNWDRRELMNVADAIRNMLKDEALTAAQKAHLGPLLAHAEEGSKSVRTSNSLMREISDKLCAFGRDHKLCTCGEAQGQMKMCKFAREHLMDNRFTP